MTTAIKFDTIDFDVPEFFLSGIFNDDVSGLSQEDANAVLAFLHSSANDLKKQGFKLSHWAVSDQDQEPAFRKFHDANYFGVKACNCVTIQAVYSPAVLLPGEQPVYPLV